MSIERIGCTIMCALFIFTYTKQKKNQGSLWWHGTKLENQVIREGGGGV